MKIKLMIALVVMALVFGMTFTACDDGEAITMKQGTNETIIDIGLLGGVDANGKLTTPKKDTAGQWYYKNPASGAETAIGDGVTPEDYIKAGSFTDARADTSNYIYKASGLPNKPGVTPTTPILP